MSGNLVPSRQDQRGLIEIAEEEERRREDDLSSFWRRETSSACIIRENIRRGKE